MWSNWKVPRLAKRHLVQLTLLVAVSLDKIWAQEGTLVKWSKNILYVDSSARNDTEFCKRLNGLTMKVITNGQVDELNRLLEDKFTELYLDTTNFQGLLDQCPSPPCCLRQSTWLLHECNETFQTACMFDNWDMDSARIWPLSRLESGPMNVTFEFGVPTFDFDRQVLFFALTELAERVDSLEEETRQLNLIAKYSLIVLIIFGVFIIFMFSYGLTCELRYFQSKKKPRSQIITPISISATYL